MENQEVKDNKMEVNLEAMEFETTTDTVKKTINGETKEVKVAKLVAKNEKAYVEAAEAAGIDKKTLEKTAKFDELYLNAAVEKAVATAETVFKDDKDLYSVDIVAPFGHQKSSKLHTDITREKTFKIPGTNDMVTKPVIKVVAETHRFNVSKAKIKRLTEDLKSKVLNG